MVVGRLVRPREALTATIAVADHVRAEIGCRVHGGGKIAEARRPGFHENELAVRTHGARHVEIKSALLRPTCVLLGVAALNSVLIDLLEAAIGCRAGRQTESGAIHCKI